jgi:hypothetical protein
MVTVTALLLLLLIIIITANKPTLPPQTLTTRAGPMMLYVPTKPKPVRPRKNYIYTPPAGLLSQSKGELYTSRHNYVSDAEESSQQKERFKKWETYNDSLRAPRFLFAYAMDINERVCSLQHVIFYCIGRVIFTSDCILYLHFFSIF